MNDYAVVIMGCNEYVDIAYFNAYFLDKYWKNSSDIIYVTETILPHNPIYNKEIATEERMLWSLRLLYALENIKKEYVILFCDDFFIDSFVDNEEIEKLIAVCRNNKLGCLKLIPSADAYEIVDEKYGNCSLGTYRLSTMPAIWNVNYLNKIAKLGVNAWDFEISGSQYSLELPDKVWCTRKEIISFVHAVNKGKWELEAIRLFKNENIPFDKFSNRKQISIVKHCYRQMGGYIIRNFPELYKIVRKIMGKE
ncbi:MAG: hypothetical protein QM697_00565 [Lachnospiraceae bacterium]